jgi:hypothetical protein
MGAWLLSSDARPATADSRAQSAARGSTALNAARAAHRTSCNFRRRPMTSCRSPRSLKRLADAGVLATWQGAAALKLAQLIDSGNGTSWCRTECQGPQGSNGCRASDRRQGSRRNLADFPRRRFPTARRATRRIFLMGSRLRPAGHSLCLSPRAGGTPSEGVRVRSCSDYTKINN